MPEFTPEQIAARELVWRHSQDGEPLYLTKSQVCDLWRSIADTGAELARRPCSRRSTASSTQTY